MNAPCNNRLGTMKIYKSLLLLLILSSSLLSAKLPDLDENKTLKKVKEMLSLHASEKEINPELMGRILKNYLEELDPTKTYFIESDIKEWLDPSPEYLSKITQEYLKANFTAFNEIFLAMTHAIERRHELEKEIDFSDLPKNVLPEEFKDMQWVKTTDELKNRILRIRALQVETASQLTEDLKDTSLQRINKRQAKNEEELLDKNKDQRNKLILTKILKATASALDTHTAYFTPEEAKQFMINVQQRLFGIGAQLRDDLNGFTVTKLVEGGPAWNSKELKAKDRIIAVNGEPVVGMDIVDAVELIRGEENTPVVLTVIREVGEQDDKKEEKLDITIIRGEVVLKEARYEVSYEPFGDGIIAYLKLHTFYQDPDSSSAQDLSRELEKLKEEHKVKGVILDLRYNSGGLLTQAVAVTGLFIGNGTVVSIKDNSGFVQHLRNIESKEVWDGPLIVLVNRVSASAAEIVAQTLQDYGRALIVGDDHTYGKGSFQTFTLIPQADQVNPEGEYKVTRGRYYTVSGKTPQLTGVLADIVFPGPLSESELGEKFSKYPLPQDAIKPNFDDDLSDIPPFQREKVRLAYKSTIQPKLTIYDQYLDTLKQNASWRLKHNKNYQTFLKELKKKKDHVEGEEEDFGQNDLQLNEAVNLMKDLVILMDASKKKAA
ncbi:S41 family peptidase [Estrella lausannensis]|nr:S41 family peptidase [Estrella lausannensis]